MRSKTFKKPRHLEGKAAKVRGCFVQLLCVLCALCGKRFRGPVWLACGVGFGDSGLGMGLEVAQECSLRSGGEMAFQDGDSDRARGALVGDEDKMAVRAALQRHLRHDGYA